MRGNRVNKVFNVNQTNKQKETKIFPFGASVVKHIKGFFANFIIRPRFVTDG